MTIDPGVLRRIDKMLRLAADPAAAPGEAENAMRMAQKLMEQHGVSSDTLEASKLETADVVSVRHVNPPAWEGILAGMIGDAFGCKILWVTSGWRGAMNQAKWRFIGQPARLEVAKYAFSVLQGQVLKARAGYVATLPSYYTRPQKAERADTFCEHFVWQVKQKVQKLALPPHEADALEQKFKSMVEGQAKPQGGKGTHADAMAGAAAGRDAYLNRPMPAGPGATLKIGG